MNSPKENFISTCFALSSKSSSEINDFGVFGLRPALLVVDMVLILGVACVCFVDLCLEDVVSFCGLDFGLSFPLFGVE